MFDQKIFFHSKYNKKSDKYNKIKYKINYFYWNKISEFLLWKGNINIKSIKGKE